MRDVESRVDRRVAVGIEPLADHLHVAAAAEERGRAETRLVLGQYAPAARLAVERLDQRVAKSVPSVALLPEPAIEFQYGVVFGDDPVFRDVLELAPMRCRAPLCLGRHFAPGVGAVRRRVARRERRCRTKAYLAAGTHPAEVRIRADLLRELAHGARGRIPRLWHGGIQLVLAAALSGDLLSVDADARVAR